MPIVAAISIAELEAVIARTMVNLSIQYLYNLDDNSNNRYSTNNTINDDTME